LVPVEDSAEIAVALLRLHFVSDQDVAAALDQVFFFQAQIGITVGLVHGILLSS
jgi:hypothetical protein